MCLSFFRHLADHLKLDGAWRQSNKHTNLPIFFSRLRPASPFLPHSLFVVYIFTVKWNYDQRVYGYVLCVLTLVTHQWEFWSAWSAADSKASQAEGAAKKWGRGGVGGGTESENRKHGKEREICTLVPGSFPLLSLPPYTSVSVSLAISFSLRLPWSLSVRASAATEGIGG